MGFASHSSGRFIPRLQRNASCGRTFTWAKSILIACTNIHCAPPDMKLCRDIRPWSGIFRSCSLILSPSRKFSKQSAHSGCGNCAALFLWRFSEAVRCRWGNIRFCCVLLFNLANARCAKMKWLTGRHRLSKRWNHWEEVREHKVHAARGGPRLRYLAGLFEESDAIPSVLGRDLGQQQAAMTCHADQ